MSTHPVPAADAPALHIRFVDTVPVLEIPESLPFDELRAWVREGIPGQLASIGGRTCRLDIGDREIKLFDLRRLKHLLRDEFSVDVTGLYLRPEAIHRYAERELKLKLFPVEMGASHELPTIEDEPEALDDPTEEYEGEDEISAEAVCDEVTEPIPEDALDKLTLPTDLEPADLVPPESEAPAEAAPSQSDLDDLACEAPRRNAPDAGSRTLTVHRTLRSGSVVRYDGDIIVFGDVNPGANLIATGNVVVLGALKGMAHAGATGDESTTILAFDFRPTQVRIARKIAIPPKPEKSGPELVAVRGDEIVIEPYRGRFR